MHYERKRRGREVGGPAPLRRARGKGHVTKHGYLVITVHGRTVLQHRQLMEQLLGRPLARHETVHHVNGNRGDNRVNGPLRNFRSGNLELWSRWQPAGQRVADKVAHAIETLELYAPELLAGRMASLKPE